MRTTEACRAFHNLAVRISNIEEKRFVLFISQPYKDDNRSIVVEGVLPL